MTIILRHPYIVACFPKYLKIIVNLSTYSPTTAQQEYRLVLYVLPVYVFMTIVMKIQSYIIMKHDKTKQKQDITVSNCVCTINGFENMIITTIH